MSSPDQVRAEFAKFGIRRTSTAELPPDDDVTMMADTYPESADGLPDDQAPPLFSRRGIVPFVTTRSSVAEGTRTTTARRCDAVSGATSGRDCHG